MATKAKGKGKSASPARSSSAASKSSGRGKPAKIKTVKGVKTALARIEEIDDILTAIRADNAMDEWEKERADLEDAVKAFALDVENYEDEAYKVTKVQGHTRYWDTDKLEKLVPKGLFLRCVNLVAAPDKIDALVKQGKLDRKVIAKAFIEKKNSPYAKITKKSEPGTDGEDEAASLAEKLK